MNLHPDQLGPEPLTTRFEGGERWWREQSGADDARPLEINRPFVFELEARLVESDIYIEGEMSGEVELECSRCVARYHHALRDRFALMLEPSRGRVPADPEGVEQLARDGICLGDDLDSGWYQGKELRLDAYLAELVALALPLQPLCREDCLGLCPMCGSDRNVERCTCEDRKPDSPFAVLEGLRARGKEREGEH